MSNYNNLAARQYPGARNIFNQAERVLSSCFSASLLLAFLTGPANASQAFVSMCCGAAGSISRVQPLSNQIAESFPTPPGAVAMVASPDGTRLFVATSSVGQNGIPGTRNEIAVILPGSGTAVRRIKLPTSIGEIVLDPSGTHIYATTLETVSGNEHLLAVNLVTGQSFTAKMPGTGPSELLPVGISADGATVFVPINKSLVKFKAATLETTGSIPISGAAVAPPLATPDGKSLLVITSNSVLDVIDLSANAVVAVVPFSTSAAVFGTALAPDGKTLYINGSDVVVVDVPSASVKTTIPLHHQAPFHIGATSDGKTVYAGDLAASTLSVIDSATATLTGTVNTLGSPYAIAFDAAANPLVLNQNASEAVAIDTATMLAEARVAVGANPQQEISTPSGTAFVENQNSGNLTAISTTTGGRTTTPVPLPGLIVPNSLAYLNGLVYASVGALVDEVDAVKFNVIRTLTIPLPNPLSTVNRIATSPSSPLIYGTFVNLQFEGGVTGGGIVQYDPQTGKTGNIDSGTFVGTALVVSNDATATFAIGSQLLTPPFNTVESFTFGPTTTKATFPSANFVDLKLSADGKTLYLLDSGGSLYVLDAGTLNLLSSISVGVVPSSLSLSSDGTQALVTDAAAFKVSIVDLKNRVVRGNIQVGGTSRGGTYLK